MEVIEPSAKIVEFDSLLDQFETCGRICYRSEGKMTPDSGKQFAANMLTRGHASTFDLNALVVEIEFHDVDFSNSFWKSDRSFLNVTTDGRLVISGSIRAWREWLMANRAFTDLCHYFIKNYPIFFGDLVAHAGYVNRMPVSPVEELKQGAEYLAHTFASVFFVVNRAVSHELVRHRVMGILQSSQRYCRLKDGVQFIEPIFFKKGSYEYLIWCLACVAAEETYLNLLKTKSPQAARTVLPNSCVTRLWMHANLKQWAHVLYLRTGGGADPSMREVMKSLAVDFDCKFGLKMKRIGMDAI